MVRDTLLAKSVVDFSDVLAKLSATNLLTHESNRACGRKDA